MEDRLENHLKAAAVRHDNKVIEWVTYAEYGWATIDSLRESGEDWITLDTKLATALKTKIKKASLKRTIDRYELVELENHGSTLNGRQILLLLYQSLATNANMTNHFNIEDLQAIVWLGDGVDQVDQFMTNWNECVQGMESTISDPELATLLYQRMEESKEFAYELKQFRLAGHRKPNTGDHTQRFLLDALQHYVDDFRMDYNTKIRRQQQAQRFGKQPSGSKTVPGAAATGGTTTGKQAKIAEVTATALAKAMAPYLGTDPKGNGRNKTVRGATSTTPATPATDTDKWLTECHACAASVLTVATQYKSFDPNKVKGGKICRKMLLHQHCEAGDQCPYHHVKGHICIPFQTLQGCPHKKCRYVHEVIGKDNTLSLKNFCEQKVKAREAEKAAAKGSGNADKSKKGDNQKGAGKGGKTSKGSKGTPAAPATITPPPKTGFPRRPPTDAGPPPAGKKARWCEYYWGPNSNGYCPKGDACTFRHEE